jgi:hypothetical protein
MLKRSSRLYKTQSHNSLYASNNWHFILRERIALFLNLWRNRNSGVKLPPTELVFCTNSQEPKYYGELCCSSLSRSILRDHLNAWGPSDSITLIEFSLISTSPVRNESPLVRVRQDLQEPVSVVNPPHTFGCVCLQRPRTREVRDNLLEAWS